MLQSENSNPEQIASFIYHEIKNVIYPFVEENVSSPGILEENDSVARIFSDAVLVYYGYPPCFLDMEAIDTCDSSWKITKCLSGKVTEKVAPLLCEAAAKGDLESLYIYISMTPNINFRTAATETFRHVWQYSLGKSYLHPYSYE